MKRTAAFVFALVLGTGSLFAVERQICGESLPRLYTAYNIFYTVPERIISSNYYGNGQSIPAGTEVVWVEYKKKKEPSYIRFQTKDGEGPFELVIRYSYHPGVDFQAFLDRLFTVKDFQELTSEFSESEIQAIQNGRCGPGMIKEAVIVTWGYPLENRTPDLEKDVWDFWENRGGLRRVHFDDQQRVLPALVKSVSVAVERFPEGDSGPYSDKEGQQRRLVASIIEKRLMAIRRKGFPVQVLSGPEAFVPGNGQLLLKVTITNYVGRAGSTILDARAELSAGDDVPFWSEIYSSHTGRSKWERCPAEVSANIVSDFEDALAQLPEQAFLNVVVDKESGLVEPSSYQGQLREKLFELKSLLDEGLITDEEYQGKRKQLLAEF